MLKFAVLAAASAVVICMLSPGTALAKSCGTVRVADPTYAGQRFVATDIRAKGVRCFAARSLVRADIADWGDGCRWRGPKFICRRGGWTCTHVDRRTGGLADVTCKGKRVRVTYVKHWPKSRSAARAVAARPGPRP